jgi:hypothetical protein
MPAPYKFYLNYMHSQTGFRASWDPGRRLQIGQIGKLDANGIFSVYSSLLNEGITPETDEALNTSDLDYTSHDNVDITAKLAGSVPIAGSVLGNTEAGFSFEFKNENSIVFQASQYRTQQLVNIGAIERAVLSKYEQGNWDKDWLIVSQLIVAGSSTIIICNSADAMLELKAKAGAGTGDLKLTDASLDLSVAHEKGSTLKYISQSGLTPLYKLMGIRHPLFGHAGLDTKGFRAETDDGGLQEQDFKTEELA